MHLLGLGVRKDTVLAASYFKEAAQQDWPAAQIHLGQTFPRSRRSQDCNDLFRSSC